MVNHKDEPEVTINADGYLILQVEDGEHLSEVEEVMGRFSFHIVDDCLIIILDEGKLEGPARLKMNLDGELIVEYDENKNVIGGILGGTYWGWLHIDILWVDIKFRKKGIGLRLLKAAEEEARKRGCHSVHVDTMSWQAPEFYKKNGYKIISELNDIPKGNKKYHLIKELNIL